MNAVECLDTAKTYTPGSVSDLLAQISIQADGRGRDMDTKSLNRLNDYEDVTEKVICKLSALTDIFAFFEYTDDKADFRKKTIAGLYYIIDDCIDDLGELKK